VTGRTKDGASFPLCIAIQRAEESQVDLSSPVNHNMPDNHDNQWQCRNVTDNSIGHGSPIKGKCAKNRQEEESTVYRGVIWVFSNISGLITFLPDGTIHNINDNFSLMLFGYRSSEVINKVGLFNYILFLNSAPIVKSILYFQFRFKLRDIYQEITILELFFLKTMLCHDCQIIIIIVLLNSVLLKYSFKTCSFKQSFPNMEYIIYNISFPAKV